jgi:flagellar basal-body rod protein FlgG
MESLFVAKTGLEAQQARLAVISQNLANVNTTGYKRGRAIFEDLLYQNVVQPGGLTSQQTEAPTGLNLGTGVRLVATDKQFSQGNLVTTTNPLDLAIEGRGFFQISLPDGTNAFTRDGTFQVNQNGEVVTSQGYTLQPSVTIPTGAQSVTVGVDGVVSAVLAGQSAPVQVGSIQLTDFVNPAGLQARGGNLYLETVSSGPPQTGTPGLNGLGKLEQGSLETSNVNVVEELVSMIETQRAYEMNSRAIETSDQMLQHLTNNV